ncbi:SRPBCC family protein [Dermacoccaceae bacterium W4C1]
MPVTEITKDIDSRTITVTAEFAAPTERVWQVYADARQLERVWGPPGCPATFVAHDLRPGTTTKYYMTGPDGQKYAGVWEITDVRPGESFSFVDRFADAETFEANAEMPAGTSTFTLTGTDTGTRLVSVTTYESAEALQQVLDMGMEEGLTQAIAQIDQLLAGTLPD